MHRFEASAGGFCGSAQSVDLKFYMDSCSLSLGFYYHNPAVWEGDVVRVPGFIGRFLDCLAEDCGHLTCFLHDSGSQTNRSICDHPLHSVNLSCVNIGPPRAAWLSSFHPSPTLRHVEPHLPQLDALLIRGPSPLLPSLARLAKELPVILLLVGDYEESSAVSPEPGWRKSLIRLWVKWYTRQQLQTASHSLTFVNSHRLFRQLEPFVPNLHEIRTTTLESSDFFERSDTCLGKPVRLLYTGRYTASKGLFDILEAMSLLVQWGEDVVLDLAGWQEKGEEDLIGRLSALAREKGIADRVVDHGYKAVGPELFAYYRQADIYVLASQSSFEGFPRTIWEAMAHSLPVVATRVGSIPDFVGGAAVLVAPRVPSELAQALSDVICRPDLRHRLITQGRELARQNTLDTQVEKLTAHIKTWLAG
jgi:hypothetical protein